MNVLFDILHFFLSSGDPGHPPDGTIWYNRALAKFRKRENGATSDLAAATPGGSDTQVQFNDAGSFGGDANHTWDKTTKTLTIKSGGSTNSALIITTNAGLGVLNVAEDNSGHAFASIGDFNQADNCVYFLLIANAVYFATPNGSSSFGDPDGFGNSTLFKVDDANQKVTSNVKAEFTGGDVSFLTNAKGPVLKDAQATPHYWRIGITTLGVLTTTDIGTSPP